MIEVIPASTSGQMRVLRAVDDANQLYLGHMEQAALRLRALAEHRATVMREAIDLGVSRREIGRIVGLSHTRVGGRVSPGASSRDA